MKVIFPKKEANCITYDPLIGLKKCLCIHGFDGKKKYFWHFITFLKSLILVGRLMYAFQTFNHPAKLAEIVATIPARVMAISKMLILFFERNRVKCLYKIISTEFWDFNITGSVVEKRIRRRLVIVKNCCFGHALMAAAFIILTLKYPLVDMPEGQRSLPNIIYTPFDTNPSPLYEFVYAILLWNLFVTILGNAFYDFFVCYCLQHLFVQYTLLKNLLTNIDQGIMEGASDIEKFNSDYFQKRIFKRLKVCVEHHVLLLKFGKTLEDFTSPVLFPQIIMSFAIFVINGYIISTSYNVTKSLGLINFTFACLLEIGVYGFQGSDLNAQSLSVIKAIGNSKWYLFRAPLKKAFLCMMINTKQGINIRAGGMIDVDNKLLVKILQKTFSAITLLRAIMLDYEGNK